MEMMVFLTGVLAFATAILAIFTHNLYEEARKTRLRLETPDVDVSYVSGRQGNTIDIVIDNISEAIAYDIKIEVPDEIKGINGEPLNKMSYMSLSKLKPSQRIVALVGVYREIDPKILNGRISYFDKSRKAYEKEFSQDLSFFGDLTLNEDQLLRISESLYGINKNLSLIAEKQK